MFIDYNPLTRSLIWNKKKIHKNQQKLLFEACSLKEDKYSVLQLYFPSRRK